MWLGFFPILVVKMAARSCFLEDDSTVIGPVLPPELAKKLTDSVSDANLKATSTDDVDFYGPALPPGFKMIESREKQVIGPSLPIGFDLEVETTDEDSDDYEAPIGPLPPSSSNANEFSRISAHFERRAEKMKNKLTKTYETEELKREEWMTVLPPEMSKNFGLGPRSFKRQTPRPTGDRSVWTETPSDSKKRNEEEEEVEGEGLESEKESLSVFAQQKYDEEMVKRIERHNKSKRSESLLDLHKRKLKRKAKGEVPKPKERRPFDRDIDLKANVFDDAKRNALIKKSRQLNDKFSSGKGKFL